jgi:hypothetical protein
MLKNQQMQQLFIQFINYVCICMDERDVSSGVVCGDPQYSIDCASVEQLSEGTRNAP